ncbi:MAG TPA: hypothetical protein PKJ99_09925 [Thermoanaerobaculales bacterium]|nr:hypothetical protein [Thermoanaerobaculales bacterium]HPA80231.1 hypothetical protein [Thermoanaerobaculales bacterium]HQL29600.1 hypothetical protein [Thermoanaerobaculales bacterium]HQN97173.1 hypothetical protein [Thermoanaerobaculales bacterium]HQP44574.1 hypothetical protein [Thermoanaerobaculales bacterium]
MQISISEPLSRAWERMRRMLFSPFDLGRWMVLGFAAWLAGLAGGGWGGNLGGNIAGRLDERSGPISSLEELWGAVTEHLVWMPLIVLGVLAALAIFVALLWVSSRAKLVFLDNVVREQAAIVEPWKRLGRLGDSLFWWRLGFIAVALAVVLVVVALVVLPVAASSLGDTLRGLSIAAVALAILGIAVVAAVVLLTLLLLDSFVVPIMYRFDLKTAAAWRSLLPWLKRYLGWFVVYILALVIGAVAFQVVVLVLCIFTCCIVLLPYVGTVILLPVWVLYRAFSVEFLAQFHPDFDLFEAAAVAPVPVEAGETASQPEPGSEPG